MKDRWLIFATGVVFTVASMGGLAHAQGTRSSDLKSVRTAAGLVQSCKALLNALAGKENYVTHLTNVEQVGLASGYCMGYIDAYVALAGVVRSQGKRAVACIPKGTQYDEIAKPFILMLDEHPELANQSAVVFALGTMLGRWKCSPEGRR